jgi:Ca2+-binding EF-hand superfamily protein
VDRAEWTSVAPVIYPSLEAIPVGFIESSFDDIDAAEIKDGQITASEFHSRLLRPDRSPEWEGFQSMMSDHYSKQYLIKNKYDLQAKDLSESQINQYQQFFDRLDLNKSGKVDIFEALTIMENSFTTEKVSKQEILLFLSIMDKNSDGSLTYDEYFTTMQTQNTPLANFVRGLFMGDVKWEDIQPLGLDMSSNDTYVQIPNENLNTNYGGFC